MAVKDILEKIKSLNFLKKKSKSFLGLDIGSSAIKIVQLKKEKGVAVLETYGELSLGPVGGTEVGRSTNLNDKQISSSLLDLIKESRVNISNCGVSIPIRSSLVFEIEVPEMPEKQLKKIVPIEARRYIPVPICHRRYSSARDANSRRHSPPMDPRREKRAKPHFLE